MGKTKRINRELAFINEHREFQLVDLMRAFSISKSTALRDINELMALGAPITAFAGCYGGYQVDSSSPLPQSL